MTEEAKGPESSAHAPRVRGRVLSDTEVSRVLETAAHLQERAERRMGGASHSPTMESGHGLTVEDLRDVAREAGIDPRFVDIAIAQGRGSLAPQRNPFGAAHRWRFNSEVPGRLTAEDRGRLVQAVRSTLDEKGEATELYGRMEWRHDDSLGPITVSVYPKDRTIEIDVTANRQGEAGTLVATGTTVGTVLGASLVASLAGVEGLPVVAGAGAVSLGLSMVVWRMRSSWWARHLRRISDQLSSMVQDIASPTADSEQDRMTSLESREGSAARGNDT